ncbi:MAG TPA: hypothetical protein V6D28_09685 [Leptolyngbyaceae cyanobacterium]
MAEQIQPNPKEAPTHDSQLAAENMVTGTEKAPEIDVSADYEASKAFSVSEIDRSGEGAKAAEEATAPQFAVSQPQQSEFKAESTGNPDRYMDMARDVNPGGEDATNVSDDLVQKALEKGKPGK